MEGGRAEEEQIPRSGGGRGVPELEEEGEGTFTEEGVRIE
jgi:hypothetical protein